MRGVEAFFLELAAVEFGFGAEVEERQQECLIAGLLALGEQILDVVRIGLVLAAIIAAEMSGDEFFVVKDVELSGFNFEGELLGGIEWGHGVTVGFENDAAAAISIGRADDRAVVGDNGQGLKQRVPSVSVWRAKFVGQLRGPRRAGCCGERGFPSARV
jgi:hypothetical protein